MASRRPGVFFLKLSAIEDYKHIVRDVRSTNAEVTMVLPDKILPAISPGSIMWISHLNRTREEMTLKVGYMHCGTLKPEFLAMFCCRSSSFVDVHEYLPIPGNQVLVIVDYRFEVPVCGTLNLRVAMFFESPRAVEGAFIWPKLAQRLVEKKVCVVVGRFKDVFHPLILLLSELIPINNIQTGTNSDFFVCVLGEVNSPTWRDNRFYTDGVWNINTPRMKSITSLIPNIAMNNQVMSIISLNGYGSNRGHRQNQRNTARGSDAD